MSSGRFVVLGLALARSPWFRSVAQWSNSGSIPLEFVKCMSALEVRAHLASSRSYSALLVDGTAPGLDRDLVDLATTRGCAVIVVDDLRVTRDWIGLGASAVINPLFERNDLVDVLVLHAGQVTRGDAVPSDPPAEELPTNAAKVAMVCGAGGTGASTAAIALAQGLCDDLRYGRMVLLADMVLHAEQAMLHDARDVVPGIQELVDAHRTGRPAIEDLRDFTFDVPDRGYQLLLGLRRARAWSTVRPRAFSAAVESVRRGWRVVVCDTDPDLEGEAEGGSVDVEERHLMARFVASMADVAFVVGNPTMKGIHGLVRVAGELVEHRIDVERVVPVVNLAPRPGRSRAELTKAIASLMGERVGSTKMPSPIFLPERPVDEALRDGQRLHSSITAPMAAAFTAVIERTGPRQHNRELSPVVPGSLGHWSHDPIGGAT